MLIIFIFVSAFSIIKYSNKLQSLLPVFKNQDYIKILDEESLINEVRNVNKIIPLEVELSESILIDQSFSDLEIFKKTKTITYYAKCSYSMDLSKLTNNDILLNNETKQIILTLNSPEVFSINIDEKKTRYSEPELGLLRFGDIVLSSEEYGQVRDKLYTTFENKMNDKMLHQQVITNASISLEKLISELIGEKYTITIKIKDT